MKCPAKIVLTGCPGQNDEALVVRFIRGYGFGVAGGGVGAAGVVGAGEVDGLLITGLYS